MNNIHINFINNIKQALTESIASHNLCSKDDLNTLFQNKFNEIGEIDYGKNDKEKIIGILDLGLKFIPNNNVYKSDLYYNTIIRI